MHQSSEAGPSCALRTVTNRAFEGLLRGFWAGRWTSSGGRTLMQQCLPEVSPHASTRPGELIDNPRDRSPHDRSPTSTTANGQTARLGRHGRHLCCLVVQSATFAWNCMARYGQLVVVFHWLTTRCRSSSVEPGTR
jgi:hypothetical protein